MYRPDKPARGPPPFGPPPLHGGPFSVAGQCGVPGPCGPFSSSAPDGPFLRNRPPRGRFISPHCSSFSVDHSTVIALGGNQQVISSAEPPHLQVPQWNPTPMEHHLKDNSDRAGEEFLRCIAANKPLPDYLKGDMAYNLAEALKSTKALKQAVMLDPEFQKHVTRRKSQSRSRSRCRSRGRSCGKSQAKSRARSKSRAHSRSRGRNKSRARGKSRARSNSRARSRSQSRSKSKSHARSKSQVRRSKSRSNSSESSYAKDIIQKRIPSYIYSSNATSSNKPSGSSLLEGLKLVMNSKEMEERLPTLKNAILTIQASGERKKVECVPEESRHQQDDSQESSTSLDNDSMLLPHDRVGSDFSWLHVHSQEDSNVQKAELDDEESFLYGNGDTGEKQGSDSSSSFFEYEKLQKMDLSALTSQQRHENKSTLSSFGDLQPFQITSSNLTSAGVDSSDCEKIKNILKGLGTTDINEIMVKMQGQREEKYLSPAPLGTNTITASWPVPALSSPNVRQALESLQSLIKATKEKRAKCDGSGTSQPSKCKAFGDGERKREKQVRISKIESLMKELEGLLKQDGLSFLTPMIGYYCQKCENFFEDLNCAENHASIHRHCNSSSPKVQMKKYIGDGKGHSHYCSNQQPQPSNRIDHRDYSYNRDSEEHRNRRDNQGDWNDEGDHRSKLDNDCITQRTRQENISLKEEMKKERMLITVSCGVMPPPNTSVKEEVNKNQGTGNHRIETDSNGNLPKDSTEKHKIKVESSDASDDDDVKGKMFKAKAPKKKKEKKKKKKKKEKKKKNS